LPTYFQSGLKVMVMGRLDDSTIMLRITRAVGIITAGVFAFFAFFAVLLSPLVWWFEMGEFFKNGESASSSLPIFISNQELVPGYITPASGLKWKKIGPHKPIDGLELMNSRNSDRLAEALSRRTEFTPQEWEEFDISNLRMAHFVKSGDFYFKPSKSAPEDELEDSTKAKRQRFIYFRSWWNAVKWTSYVLAGFTVSYPRQSFAQGVRMSALFLHRAM
jgi:hypothetical protein